jgi:glycosyltransferase involved in cell wall biosynthesis
MRMAWISRGAHVMRRLLVVSEGEQFVCYRYRWAAFAPALAAAGWRLEHVQRPRGGREFVRTLKAIAAADAVVIQRRLVSVGKAWLIRRAARTLLYDFDDAVHLRDSNSGSRADAPVRWSRFRQMVRMADASLAGSPQLVTHALSAAPAARVHLVPTCIDPRGYALAAHDRPAGGPEMVWIGSRSTANSLGDAMPWLRAACAGAPAARLTLISDSVPELPGVRTRHVPWHESTETADLAGGDIGISWLPDHPWSLGKCGLKVLQYMAAGLPVVANSVGIHARLVVHGETGFLADDPEACRQAVATLAASADLRRRMGQAGRDRMEREWNVAGWGPRLAAIVTAAFARSAPQRVAA